MALVQTYADQEVQCVARSEDEAYWGLFRERERIGDGIRAYLDAMLTNAYAEGREDEREQVLAELRTAREKLDAAIANADAPKTPDDYWLHVRGCDCKYCAWERANGGDPLSQAASEFRREGKK